MSVKTPEPTGSDPVDIGNAGDPALLSVVGYYLPSDKMTEEGVAFKTYYGLRQYYITGNYYGRLLTLTDPSEILALSRQAKWLHVSDLRMRLMSALIHNVRRHPHVLQLANEVSEFCWRSKPRLNPHEKIWLNVVNAVFDRQ